MVRQRGRTCRPADPEAIFSNCTGSADRRVSYRGVNEKSRCRTRPAPMACGGVESRHAGSTGWCPAQTEPLAPIAGVAPGPHAARLPIDIHVGA